MNRPDAEKILQEIRDWHDDFDLGPIIWFSPWPLPERTFYILQDGPTRRLIVSPEYRELITQAVASGLLRARLPKKVENARFELPGEPQDLEGSAGPKSGTGERRTALHRQSLFSRWAALFRRSGGSAR